MKKNIKETALDYMQSHEHNFYAEDNNVTLYIGPTAVDVESIWRNKDEDKIYLHVGCKEFEGDLDIESLSEENQWMLLGVFTGDWERFNAVTEPAELEFYSIEDDGHGGKQVHLLGYTYDTGDSDNGSGTWRGLEPCFVIVPLKEFIDGVATEEGYTDRLICEAKQYEGDYTGEGIVDYINHYFNGKPADYRLGYGEITEDTPCGNYIA